MSESVPQILLVDDEPRNLRILEGILAPLRFDLRGAGSGQEALDQVEADPPDLVLLDVMMPGLTGFDVCRRLKEQPETLFIPVILVTGLIEQESKIAGLEAGADDFINKPVNPHELRARVQSLLRLKQLHDELQQKNLDLEQANQQIQQASHHKSDFLARMSHDLRTPMNAILGYTRILLRRAEDTLDSRQYRNLENIQSSASHLLLLINDIMDLSRIEAGRIDMHPREVDLRAMISEGTAIMGSLLKPGVELVQELEEVAPLYTDIDWVRRVLMNLLSNAVKFTREGSITVSLKAIDGGVELSVADTGLGIPPDDLPRIFEEFRQADRQGEGEKEGSGLGLAIAKKAVELLGGTISAESELGKGTVFSLQLGNYQDC